MSVNGWIGVDLDGTLARYTTWQGTTHIGKPIKAMVDRVKKWLEQGYEVRIMTARVYDGGTPEGYQCARLARAAIEEWCLKHLGQKLRVTCVKDYQMVELWDDRAVQVEMNTGTLIGRSTRGLA